MPLYKYRCLGCEKEFEVVQKMSDEPLSKCKECKKELQKLVASNSFTLKGSGWFQDGY